MKFKAGCRLLRLRRLKFQSLRCSVVTRLRSARVFLTARASSWSMFCLQRPAVDGTTGKSKKNHGNPQEQKQQRFVLLPFLLKAKSMFHWTEKPGPGNPRLRRILQRLKKQEEDEEEGDCASSLPQGRVALRVGEERKRFVVPIRHLYHPFFQKLLLDAENEFQFHYSDGPLTVPCNVDDFNLVKWLIEREKILAS